ncbi:endoplasmic reticulum transmembrane helix translocase [Halictus rubicundus]|uniref:endoplasmic reticulum transmembrane helix translocase n=1 Tax=Halictus rubicundus TaxID=77578 RepID=UPI0040362891
MATIATTRIDELVQSVTLHKPRKLLFTGYILPFAVLYTIWIYSWIFVYGVNEYYEAGLVGVAAIGLLQIFICLCCQWSVHVYTFLNCSSEKTPYNATVAKVVPTPNNGSSELVKLYHSNQQEPWFIFQKTKYYWNPTKKHFDGLQFPIHHSVKHYREWTGYLNESEIVFAEKKYGKNKLDMVVPEFSELFKERATAPFFVFQVFCVSLWCLDRYWYYSIFTIIMLIMFECTLVQQQLRNMAEIRKMGNKPYMMMVYRNRRWRSMFTDQLVPGDIVSITRSQSDNLVPCDMLLLRGLCVVDESMLTGESVPQMKEPVDDIGDDRQLDIECDKLHVLFGGTKVVQHTAPSKSVPGLKATDNGCVAYVLRTGFSTSQGKLLRTILFGVKRVTANNLETFGFILFLLIFAVAAATYVWIKGSEDPTRNRYKLFLECTLILTSVFPPELPIELSLAVNTSLLALSKLGVFCTEPFRIPFAGKVEICCFDKTGTLTSDNLVVEGIAGLEEKAEVMQLSDAPIESIQVLATCHSLVQIDDGIVGDPLEKATLKAINWTLTKNDCMIPRKGGQSPALRIVHRHHFSSALKRMSVIAGYTMAGSSELNYMATVKGAPEIIKTMLSSVPKNYDSTYLSLSRRGARVLALGYRKISGPLSSQDLRELTREDLEKNLTFAGFVIISCPLKPDSKVVIKEIVNASHSVVMITGDNPLTACHVSRELHFTKKPSTLILTLTDEEWLWESVDGEISLPLGMKNVNRGKEIWREHALCVTGEGLTYLRENDRDLLRTLLPHIVIFARCEPKQKEFIIVTLQDLGYSTLMCGDGTNDVGALKHAQVGVAILSSPPERASKRKQQDDARNETMMLNSPVVNGPRMNSRMSGNSRYNTRIQKLLKELDEQPVIVKLGDASIAAPFTSKMSSIECICHVIKQGRCTLVTTLQMFKILAINALGAAYSQSVLYLDGIKFSDAQATLQGGLIATYFLFISRSKPLKTLSKQRPLPNIFNLYTISTVLLQFAIHFVSLVYLVREATILAPRNDTLSIILATNYTPQNDSASASADDKDKPFEANLINSTVYIVVMTIQVFTFAINYRGFPYMESLMQNKSLLYSFIGTIAVILGLCGFVPDLAAQFEIVEFPRDFRNLLVQVMIANLVLAYMADRACLRLFGEGRYRKL